ncbi:MAG: DUF167 domain-containing protein [Alphaproteobacteria bacterium]|jgi:hypothetical protein|nr:DUF167 domain-containing protein [Alphaproteobacteria bacterium]HJP21834.1 DUF167 domain-containing protein [Alphaproteobacteria bacterium]
MTSRQGYWAEGSPFATAQGGVRVAVRLTPKAGANGIDGALATKNGPALKVRVTAAPEKGRANTAMLKLLAREWRLPASALVIEAGAKERHKRILVRAEEEQLKRLRGWAKQRGYLS